MPFTQKLDLIKYGKLKFAVRRAYWGDYSPYWGIFYRGHYDMLRIRRDDNVLDAGAHIGFFTCKAAQKAKLVIAVESHPEHFKLLQYNIKINNLDNVIPVNKALTNKSRHVMLLDNGVGTRVSAAGSIKVESTTIDELLDRLGLNLDVVKMDVEGSEASCLDGHYLDSVRELMVETDGETECIVKNILKNHGFETTLFKPHINMIFPKIIKNIASVMEAEASSKFGLFKHLLRHRWPNLIRLRLRGPLTKTESVQLFYGNRHVSKI
jgi:FkbM family methyltransferase